VFELLSLLNAPVEDEAPEAVDATLGTFLLGKVFVIDFAFDCRTHFLLSDGPSCTGTATRIPRMMDGGITLVSGTEGRSAVKGSVTTPCDPERFATPTEVEKSRLSCRQIWSFMRSLMAGVASPASGVAAE
jgi:hypothetical protein